MLLLQPWIYIHLVVVVLATVVVVELVLLVAGEVVLVGLQPDRPLELVLLVA